MRNILYVAAVTAIMSLSGCYRNTTTLTPGSYAGVVDGRKVDFYVSPSGEGRSDCLAIVDHTSAFDLKRPIFIRDDGCDCVEDAVEVSDFDGLVCKAQKLVKPENRFQEQ